MGDDVVSMIHDISIPPLDNDHYPLHISATGSPSSTMWEDEGHAPDQSAVLSVFCGNHPHMQIHDPRPFFLICPNSPISSMSVGTSSA